jgi:hypothetical protein
LEENFDRFNFAIHKEKEMNFRRWITALAVLALFAGFASAQVANSGANSGSLSCTASVAVPPTMRSEGLTELAGDIVLTCQGGPTPVAGTQIGIANIMVSFGTNVTSRLLTNSTLTPSALTASNTSEAMLMIDEPGSGLAIGPPGYAGPGGIGPQATQFLCGAASPGVAGVPLSLVGAGNGGCVEYVAVAPGGDYVASSSSTGFLAAPNLFSGVVSSNQVTFYGIPILPPTSTGVARVFRMTNIRINANALGGGGLAGTTQVLASISISGNSSVPVNAPVQIAGFVQSGLSVSTRNTGNYSGLGTPNFNQCSTANVVSGLGVLRYTENFGTAFKTRVAPTLAYNGQAIATGQNIPGAIYNSESGFVSSLVSGVNNNSTVGLADYGTRLKAVFNNVPTGVRIFVSTTNVVNIAAATTGITQPAGIATTSFAQLVLSDTAIDGNGTAPVVPISGYTTPSGSVSIVNNYAELSVVNNSASATWEVINTNPATPESFDFGVWVAYTANPATNTPPPGTASVNMSYGPVPPSFSASAGATASATLTVPRFADLSTATNVLNIVQCTTSLLFPFVTNQAGFDTGVALMNTTSDPFGTKPQAGTCAMNFYGQNAPPQYVTASIASGMNISPSVYSFLASSIAPNFQGYMIAVCNFQLAHGYAFVSDLGAQKLAHGYIALVLNNGTGSRPSGTSVPSGTTEALEN